jgi:hypothetical protein
MWILAVYAVFLTADAAALIHLRVVLDQSPVRTFHCLMQSRDSAFPSLARACRRIAALAFPDCEKTVMRCENSSYTHLKIHAPENMVVY